VAGREAPDVALDHGAVANTGGQGTERRHGTIVDSSPVAAGLLDRLVSELSEFALVLDVGGWANPHPRADWVIDVGPWETRNWYSDALGAPRPTAPERFTRDTWIVHDVCAPGPWPLEDARFDFAICSQTLEDVRDPVKVCAELSRVARAGYVETPQAAVELTRGVESPLWCGWRHHRWLVERDGDGLVFLAKPHHVHNPFWPAIRSPRLLTEDAAAPLRLAWNGSLPAREEMLIDSAALDQRLLEIVARSARPDAVGAARRSVLERAWRGYRAGRAAVGGRIRSTR
jgi:hypothetical protein